MEIKICYNYYPLVMDEQYENTQYTRTVPDII